MVGKGMRAIGRAGGAEGFIPGFAPFTGGKVYDFDETLVKYPKGTLESELFKPDSIRKASLTDLGERVKRTGDPINILTARANDSHAAIKDFLTKNGIQFNKIIPSANMYTNVGRHGEMDSAGKKGKFLESIWKKNKLPIELIDDSIANIKRIEALGNKDITGRLYQEEGQQGLGQNLSPLKKKSRRLEKIARIMKAKGKTGIYETIKRIKFGGRKPMAMAGGWVPNFGALNRGPMKIPKILEQIAKEIQGAKKGANSQIIGGATRDHLLGIKPKDYDMEIFGLTQEKLLPILSKYGKLSKHEVGPNNFGVFKLRRGKEEYDFTLPRREVKLEGSGRRDFGVEVDPMMSKAEAATRRDLTVNAIGYDPLKKKFLDNEMSTLGIRDLESKIMRPTSPKFMEDPLRVLRAMQFAGRYGMTADQSLIKHSKSMVNQFSSLPKERVRDEWMKWATKSTDPGKGLEFLKQSGWIKHFPEIEKLSAIKQSPKWHPEGDVFEHVKLVTDSLAKNKGWQKLNEKSRGKVMLSALTHDFGKATHTQMTSKGITSRGHAEAGVEPMKKFLGRIMSKGEASKLSKQIEPYVKEHMFHTGFPSNITEKSIRRLSSRLAKGGGTMEEFIPLMEADLGGRGLQPTGSRANIKHMNEVKKMVAKLKLAQGGPKRLIEGRHLLANNLMKPGPQMGGVLKLLEEAQLQGRFRTESGGLSYFKKHQRDLLGKTAAEGFIPNFSVSAKWLKKRGVSKLGEGLMRATDAKTGTWTDFAKDGARVRIANASRGPKDLRGGAYRNFKTINEYAKKSGAKGVYSGDIIQQRIGKGVSPWEQIVNSFPQLKYRIQKGMKTSGSFQLGEGNEFNFKSLTDFKKQIKSHVKKYGKEDLEWLDTNMRMNFGEEVQGFDWMTSRTKGMGDAAARFKAGGFVPNFAAAMRGGRGSLDRRAIDRGASLKRAELGGASALDEYVKRELIGKNFTTLSRTVGDSWQSRAISGQALSMAGETGFKNSLFGAIAKTYKGGMVPAGENPIITAKNWANVPGDKKRSLSKQWRNLNLAPKKPADPVYNSDEQFYRDILSRRTYAGGHVPNFMRVSRLSKRAPNTVKKGSGRFLKDEWAEKSLIESRGVAGNRWSVMDAKRDLGLHQDKGRWSKLDHRKWRRYIIKSHGEAAYVKVGEGARKIQNLPLDKADDALQVFGFSGGHVPNFAGGAPSWFRPADQRRRGLSQGRSYRRLASDDHNAEVFAALKRKTRGSLDKVKQKLVEKMVGVYIKGGLPARVGADAITSLVSGTAAGLPLQAYALDMASMHGKGLMEMGKNLWGGRNPFKGLGSHYESQLTARSPLGPVGGNATYGGGYTPNFASKFSTQAYTRGTGMRHTDALIKQPSNPDFIGNMKSYMEYNKSGAGMRHIDMMRSYNKGDAFELMRAASRQKFMKDGGAYTSKTLKQQRSFMQGGRTNFEDLVYSFPQLKYRMQEGLKSSGLFSMGSPISRNHSKFNNLGELKKNVNKMSRKDFKEALGNGNNIQLRDLETKLVKQSSDGGIYNNIAAQGFIPNFANELLASMKRESYASGRAAIPVFSKKLKRTVVWNKGQESKYGKGQVDKAIQRDHLDRGQDPRTLHATGSGKERYAASGFVPGFAGFGLDLGALQQLEKAKIKAEQRGMINAGDTVSAERKAAEKAMLEAKIKADAAVAEKAAAEKAAGARVAAEQARLRVEAGKDPKPARGTQADRRGEVRKGHHSQGAGVRLPLEPKAVAPMRPTPPPVVDFAPPRPSKYGVSQSGPLSTAPVDPSMVRAQHGVLEGTARTVKGSPVGMEMKGIQAEIARHESVMNRGSNVPAAVKSTGQPLATLGEVGSKSGQALGVAGGKAQSTAQARAMAVAEFGGAAQSVTDHGKFKEATAAKETTKAVTDLKKTVEKGDAATVKATEKTAADLKKSIQVDRKTARLTGQGQTPRNLLPHERALELRGKLMEERGVGRGSATRQAQIQANNELRSSGDERRVKKGWMKRQAARTFELNRVIGSEAPLQIHEKAKLERSQAVSGASKIDPKSEAGKNTAAARPVEEGTTNRAAARRAAEVKQAAQKESSRNNRERQQRQSEERRARTGTREAQRAAAARGALDQRAAAKSQKPVTSAIEGGQRAMGLAFMGQIAASVALPYAEDYAKKQKEGGGVFSEAGGAGALKGGLQFGQFGIMAMFLKGGAWGVAIAAAIAALGALIHAFDMGTENSKELAERGQKERGEKGKKIQREVEQRSSAMQAYAAYTRTKKTATNVEDVKSAKRKFRTAVSGVEDRDDRQKLLDFERKGSSFRTAREWSEKRDQKSIGEAGELKATNVFDVAAFEEGFSEEGKEMDEVNRIYNDSATGFANAMDKLSKEDLEGFKKKLEETGNVKWGILSDMEEMRDGEQGSAEFKEAQSRFMGRKLSTEEIQTLKVDIEKAAGKSEVLDRAATDAGEGSQEAFKKAVVAFNEGVIRAIDNKEDEEDDTEAVKAVKLNEVFEQLGEEIEHQKKMFSEYNSIIKKAADAHVNLIATIDQSAIDLSVGWASAMSGLEANVDSFNADFAERSGEIGGFEKIERQFAARRAEAGRDKSIGQTQADSTMRVKIQQQEGLATNQWEDKAREYNQRADMKINEYIMKQQQGGDDDMKGDDKRIITELQDKVLADFDKGNKGVGGKAGRMKSADSLAQAVVEATTKNLFQPLDEDAGVKEYRKAQVDAKKAIEVSQKGTGRGGDIPDVGGQSQGSDALEKEFREKKELFEALRAARSSFFERTSTISKGTDSEIGDYTTRWTETNTMDQEEIYKRLKKGLAAGDKQLSGFAVGREEGGDTTYSHTKNYAAGRSTTMTPRQATLFVEEYEKDPSKRLMGKHGQEHISVRTNKNVSGPPIRDDDVHRVGTKGGGLHRTDPMSVADQKAIMNVKGWGERMQSLKYDLAHGGQDLQQRKETAVERTKALEGKSEALERFKGPGEVNALRVAMEDKRKKGKMIQTGEIGGDLIDILRRNNSLETAALYKIDENFQSEQRQLHAENDRQTRELQQNRKVAEAQLKVEEEQAMKLEALDNLNTLSSKMVTGGELRKLYASAGVVSAARNSGSMSDKALRANSKKSIADITGISQLFNKQDRMDLAGNNVRLYTDALRAGGDDQSADEIERIWNKTKEQMESGEIATPFASAEEKLEEAINSLTTEMRAQSEADEAKLFTFEIPEKLAASWDSLEQGIANLASAPLMDGSALNSLEQADRDLTTQIQNLTTTLDKLDSIKPGGGGGQWNEEQLTGTDTNDDNFVQQISARKLIDKKRILLEQGLAGENEEQWGKDVEEWDTIDKHLKDITGAKWNAKDQAWEQKSDAQMRSEGIDPTALPFGQDRSRQYESFRTSGVKTVRHPKTGKYDTGYEEEIGRYYEHQKRNKTGGIGRTGKGSRDTDATFFTGESNPYGGGRLQTSPEGDGTLPSYGTLGATRYTPERLRELAEATRKKDAAKHAKNARLNAQRRLKTQQQLIRRQRVSPMQLPPLNTTPVASPSRILFGNNAPIARQMHSTGQPIGIQGSNISPPPPASRRPGSWLPPLPKTEPPGLPLATVAQSIPRRELFNPEGDLREDATVEELNRSMSELQELVNRLGSKTSASGGPSLTQSTYPGLITATTERLAAVNARLSTANDPFQSTAAPITTGDQGVVGDAGAGGAAGAGEPLVSALTTLRTAVQNSNASESTAVLTQALTENKEALAGFSEAVQNISQSVEHSVDGALDIDLGIGNLGGIIEAAMGPVKAAIVEQVKASVLQQINGLRVDLGLTGN
jgi:tRNA nucleotidyltransferase (CCA-adding enzyme)